MIRHRISLQVLLAVTVAICLPLEAQDASKLADGILQNAGVAGGLVVHLGATDARLTAALGARDAFTVQSLVRDAEQLNAARALIRSQGIYGRVSVEMQTGKALPYADNLVNLVVVENSGEVSPDEVMRVLAPRGVAMVREGGTWHKRVKPWPEEIDEWSHYLHDASNNAVADDQVVAPPRCLQWVAGPLWLRSHETPSGIQSPVSAGGRLFYFLDEGLIGITDERLPDRWSLVCRDAFNGKQLWRKPLEKWGWREWSYDRYAGKDWTLLRAARTDVPPENQRRIVATADYVYATLTYRGPVSILNARTGEAIATVAETADAHEILASDGIVVVYTQRGSAGQAERRGDSSALETGLTAFDGRSGKVLWQTPCPTIRPLMLAVDNGRVIYLAGGKLAALNLHDGQSLWSADCRLTPKTLLIADEVVVMQGGSTMAAYDATNGSALWKEKGQSIGGAESEDLFAVNGLVFRGIISVDQQLQPTRKSPNAMVIGRDLRTGEERRRVVVMNLRSPEHHHRCYRNKATTRFLVSSYEGAEFLDFWDGQHGQHNWIRGACRTGMTPCNGMLYVPPDQCFCQPGAKLRGYTAVKAPPATPVIPLPDDQRLIKGPAYGIEGRSAGQSQTDDWPTFRHDPARSGATHTAISPGVRQRWKVAIGGKLTQPVAAQGKVFVAASEAHTVYAVDQATGEIAWTFIAGGRIDSPPTIHEGLVLFGCKDGRVYCLRSTDGQLVWEFLAAPADLRIGAFDQVESVWPVHGSVLVADGIAYFTAGRSTYLDGGIRLYGLDPASGRILHKGLLEGPHRSVPKDRDLGFFILGANSDVLVSEGGYLYMRQKKLTKELEEIPVEVLCSKGSQDVGLHLFSTSGLLDGSWYNRTFWMYSKRWPGFQLANQAPKAGQLLSVDEKYTYALRVFSRRNVHSPMFFPATDGYLIFADDNDNEPQIVGEPKAREPLRWLPQSDYSRARGNEVRLLNSLAFGQDKGIGYTRAEPPRWMQWLPIRVRGMVKTDQCLFVAGAPDVLDSKDPFAPFEGRTEARLVALSAADGKKLAEQQLERPPVFDGLIAANGCLFISQTDGCLVCLDN